MMPNITRTKLIALSKLFKSLSNNLEFAYSPGIKCERFWISVGKAGELLNNVYPIPEEVIGCFDSFLLHLSDGAPFYADMALKSGIKPAFGRYMIQLIDTNPQIFSYPTKN